MSGQIYNEPFAMIPEWILDAEISDRAVRVWCVLHRHAGKKGTAFPGRTSMAKRCGCSTTSIDRALNELRKVGAIVSEQIVEDGAIVGNNYWLWPASPYAPEEMGGSTGAARGGSTGASRVAAPEARQERESLNESQLEREEPPDAPAGAAPEVVELCEYLSLRIARHRGDETVRPKISKGWYTDMRLLLERGPADVMPAKAISAEQVRKGIDFLFDNLNVSDGGRRPFCWANVIQSPSKLRVHWTSLVAAARQKNIGRVNPNTRNVMKAAMRPGEPSDAAKLFRGELSAPQAKEN